MELVVERSREAGNDTNQDDEGDTIADTAVSDTLAKPHDEHRAGSKDDGQVSQGPKAQRKSGAVGSPVDLNLKIHQIGRSLKDEYKHRQQACVLVQFLTAALTFPLHFLEGRQDHTAKLDNDRRRDVRHDAQREYGCLREGAAREHIQKLHQTALVGKIGKSVDVRRRYAGEHNVAPQPVDEYQQECYEYSLAQLLDCPDVFERVDKSHNQILFAVPPAASMAALAASEKAWASTVSATAIVPPARIFASWPRRR